MLRPQIMVRCGRFALEGAGDLLCKIRCADELPKTQGLPLSFHISPYGEGTKASTRLFNHPSTARYRAVM